jgi:hypothetical protein
MLIALLDTQNGCGLFLIVGPLRIPGAAELWQIAKRAIHLAS